MDEKSCVVGNALDLIVTNLVGCGIQPRPEIDDPVLRSEILDLWNDWTAEADAFPLKATLCGQCQTEAVIVMDGCLTCLNCGDSKCG